MPRIALDLEPHKNLVIHAVEAGATHQDVLELLEEHGVRVSLATLKRRLNAWSVPSKLLYTEDTPTLRGLIAHHFNVLQITDDESLRILNDNGIVIRKTTMQRIRRRMGLLKRLPPIRATAASRVPSADASSSCVS
nr:hypothetical protein CFP56_37210 [Quercus suber]